MGKNNEIDMINGGIVKKIFLFALPVLLTGILQLLFNTIDVIVVGKFAGNEALAGVGSTSSLINLIVCLFTGISVGVSVVMGNFCGARDYKNAAKTLHTSIVLALICGIIVFIIGEILTKPLLILMGTPISIINKSILYMRIIFIGIPAMLMYNFGAGILRAIGDTKRPLYFLSFAGVVNVVLNLIFVVVFEMNVAGVAIATVVSHYISSSLVLLFLARSNGYLKLEFNKLSFDLEKVKLMLKIGLPAGFQGILFSISNVLIQSSINSFGQLVIAGNTASVNIESFIYISMNAIYQTALSFTSQNYGAKKYDRIDRVYLNCLFIVLLVGGGLGFLVYTFGANLLSLYTNEPKVIEYGMNRLFVICTLYFLCGILEVTSGVLRGMGYSLFPMVVTLTGVCLFRIIWVFTIFAMYRTAYTLYISYPISWFMTFVAELIFYLFIRKKFRKL